MTWFSRLIPQSPGLRRLPDHDHRAWARQRQRRRRKLNLEGLEPRLALASNIDVVYDPIDPVTGLPLDSHLKITGDKCGDTMTILERSVANGGTVTITSPGKI